MARDLTALYKIATDPSSTQKQLKEVWKETKSVKVRKAVASNLNCDPDTLRMAARLYLKEVIENPSFEMLKLFDQDPFISKLFDAFEAPDSYANKNKSKFSSYSASKGSDETLLARAMLLSPKLASHNTVRAIYNTLGITEIKRELKDEEVRKRLRKVVVPRNNTALLKNIEAGVVLDLYNTEVITLDEFDKFLENCRAGSLNSGSGGSVKRLIESQLNQLTADNYGLIFRLMVACGNYTVKNAMKSLMTKSGGDKFVSIVGMLYKDMTYYDLVRLRKENSKNARSYYTYYASSSCCSYQIHSAMWKFLQLKYLGDSKSWKDVNITSFMRDLESLGLITPYSLYDPKLKIKNHDGEKFDVRLKIMEEILNISSDSQFVYVLGNLLKDTELYAKSLPGSVDYLIAERVNRISAEMLARGEQPLVRYTDISGGLPVYCIDYSHTVKDYPLRNCDKDSPVPTLSGMIDKSAIEGLVG